MPLLTPTTPCARLTVLHRNSWVSGGALATKHRGTRSSGLTCPWDWLATFASIAGVDPTDHRAAAAGLPPIDSVSMW